MYLLLRKVLLLQEAQFGANKKHVNCQSNGNSQDDNEHASVLSSRHITGCHRVTSRRRVTRSAGNHMNPRMTERHTHDRAAAIWLHENPAGLEYARKPRFQGFPSSSSAHATIPLQDQLALMEQLAHRARHPGFALDPLDVEILGVLVRPVIGIHRLAERLRGRFPVAILVAIAMAARLALPGNGPELLRHLLTVLRLLAFLCLLTGALGGQRSEEPTSELQSPMG